MTRDPVWPLHHWVVLLQVGGFTFVTFGLFAAVGGTAAAWVIAARQVQAGLPVEDFVWTEVLLVPLLALVGSRLFALVLLEWRDLWTDPRATLMRTTLAWQGGFLAVTAGMLWVAARHDIDPLLWVETFVFGVPVGQAFGRVGCHTYGCCHGRPTDRPWGIVIRNPHSKVVWGSGFRGRAIHPAQLYSAAANALLVGVLAALAAAGPHPVGTIGATFLVLDGAKRFLLELFRGIPVRRFLRLTPFQWGALLQVACGVWVGALSVGRPTVDFASGLGQALAHSAVWFPAYLACGLSMFVLMGVHRGRPGSLGPSPTGYRSRSRGHTPT